LIEQTRSAGAATAEATDICGAVTQRLAFWEVLARSQERVVEASISPGPAPVLIPRDEFDAAVDALIGNVISHTPKGTPFYVRVAPVVGSDTWQLVIEDDGPGLSPEVLSRGESGAGGTGLGLDIARQCARRARGTISIGPGIRGGARIEIRFPVHREAEITTSR
jgi:signal transduction histidine kinase